MSPEQIRKRNHEQILDYQNQLHEQRRQQQLEDKSPEGLVKSEKGETEMHPLLAGRTKGLAL